MNKYIRNKGFLVRYDLEALLLCFDYFNHGLRLPIWIDSTFARRCIHTFARLIIIFAYFLRLYELRYRIDRIDDNAVVILKGIGKWSNTVKLVKRGNTLTIIKKPMYKSAYLREKRFYELYKDTNTRIQLPICVFKENNVIEIEFLKMHSFQRQIRDGSITLSQALHHFGVIKKNLKNLYKVKKTIIHGDLCPENIYIQKDRYILIDFTDSHFDDIQFDLYTLLERILFTLPHIISTAEAFRTYSYNKIPIRNLLDSTPEELANVEKQITFHKKKRFPERFT